MESSFRHTLFNDLINIKDNLSDSEYEHEVFNYLKNLDKHPSYDQLKIYSNKLKNLKDFTWLNANINAENSEINELLFKGKIVLIDFWTYCCINCMHIIPLLNQLEQQYDELVVIGVHSSKFTNEKSKLNILSATRRHLIKHPIVCDFELKLWNLFEIICWPTLMLINPNGIVIGIFEGELQANIVKKVLPCCFKYYKNNLIKSSLDIFQLNENQLDMDNLLNKNNLSFPTKLCADFVNNLLFISDSGNNRIVCVNVKNSKIIYVIGNGKRGHLDGNFDDAQFDWPQGLAFDAETNQLYIADTFNDVIRIADLNKLSVKTLCGVPNKTSLKLIGDYDLIGGNTGDKQSISSPWDIQLLKKDSSICILIACAGTHQIWLYSFKNDLVRENLEKSSLDWWKKQKIEWNKLICIAGNGKERNKNNSYPLQASFAQPSGLCLDSLNENLYIADAESSSIRVLNLNDGSVKNIAGGDHLDPDNLFGFGECDGKGNSAKFQHPLDVRCISSDHLLIADTYNNSIRKIDIKTKLVQKLSIEENESKLSEPNGLCVFDDKIFIADTNNHLIKFIKLNTESTIKLEIFPIEFENIDIIDSSLKKLTLNEKKIKIKLNDISLNEKADNRWKIKVQNKNTKFEIKTEGSLIKCDNGTYKLEDFRLNIADLAKFELKLKLFYCVIEKKSEVCKFIKLVKTYLKDDINNSISLIDSDSILLPIQL